MLPGVRTVELRVTHVEIPTMTSAEDGDATRWHDLQKQVVKLMITGKTHETTMLIDAFVTGSSVPSIRAAALGFRADLKAKAGELPGALTDYEAAVSMTSAPGYARYSLEVAIGGVHQRLGESPRSLEWYRRALETALFETDRTGATALLGMAALDEDLEAADQTLCERVARKAWAGAGLAGEPDLTSLADVANAIINAK
jgi:tetratricopeptide (TPR) repeat protein